jgi:hypothetical protein
MSLEPHFGSVKAKMTLGCPADNPPESEFVGLTLNVGLQIRYSVYI